MRATILLGLAVLCIWALSPQPAHAQDAPLPAPIGQADFEEYRNVLITSRDQRAAADDIYDAYLNSCRNIHMEITTLLNNRERTVAKATEKPEARAALFKQVQDLEDRVDTASESLLSDLRAIGNVQEADNRWLKVQRTLLRRQVLPTCGGGKRGVDLLAIRPSTGDAKTLDGLFDQYELDMDELLRQVKKAGQKRVKWFCDPEYWDERGLPKSIRALPKLQQVRQELFDLEKRVMRLNDNTVAAVMNATDAAIAQEFERKFLQAARPDVFTPSVQSIRQNSLIAKSAEGSEERKRLEDVKQVFVARERQLRMGLFKAICEREDKEREMFSGKVPADQSMTADVSAQILHARHSLDAMYAEWDVAMENESAATGQPETPRRSVP